MIPLPPQLSDLPAGAKLRAGLGYSTVLPDIDFETYSPAGFVWNAAMDRFDPPLNAKTKGLQTVGAAVYSEHPDTEVLCMAYNLKDGLGSRLWIPGESPYPFDLAAHVLKGGLLEAWNSMFEYWIWTNVCVPKYKFPPLPIHQLRCAMAKSRASAYPGHLADAGKILNIEHQKLDDGKRLIKLFSIPRDPTLKNRSTRIKPSELPADRALLHAYNLRDIEAEAEISSLLPDLNPFELEFWLCDQRINARGVQLDIDAIHKAIAVVKQAHDTYNGELYDLTDGNVLSASAISQLKRWVESRGVAIPGLDADSIIEILKRSDLPHDVRRVLEIRQLISSAAVKKLYAMLHTATRAGRVHDLFAYHSARTGRAAGRGVQPQNLPNSGPEVSICVRKECGRYYGKHLYTCPWCGCYSLREHREWNPDAVNCAVDTIAAGDLGLVELYWGNAIDVVSACLRGMFISKPGHDLICSDYSAIEAVVLAALAGEQWRLDVFNSHGKIYEMSASKVTGLPFSEFERYRKETGKHHDARKIGKVAELASGYGGWIGAWKAFGADAFMSEEDIKQAILAWRESSPAIVEFWGGQTRYWTPEYYGLEGAAIQAVLNPGSEFTHRGIAYRMVADTLYCTLPSGRYLTYHRPRLRPSERRRNEHALSFEGWNTNPKTGASGWVRMDTYGGKLTENVVQAVARDLLAHAIVNLEKSGYPVVLHIHDEIVSEIPEGLGSIAEFESIMSTSPAWAKGWPVRASGGWRAKRYAK